MPPTLTFFLSFLTPLSETHKSSIPLNLSWTAVNQAISGNSAYKGRPERAAQRRVSDGQEESKSIGSADPPEVFGSSAPEEPVDLAPLHAKIGRLALENDFLEPVLTKAGVFGN